MIVHLKLVVAWLHSLICDVVQDQNLTATVFSRINDADTVQIVVKGGYWILVLIIPLIVLLCSTCKIRRRLLERSFLKTMTLLKHAKDYFHDKQNNYKPVTDEIP